MTIPIMKPQLPTFDKIVPYLRKIDSNHWYSNSGPLVREYERRLEKLFKCPVVSASSATSVLTASIIALGLPKGSLIACPSWTFAATPAAIVAAGHVPYFMDVDVRDHMIINGKEGCPVVAMVMVIPFGIANTFNIKTSIPTVVDASAAFDFVSTSSLVNDIPVVFSTHCTKVFSTGEGGFVACQDKKFLEDVKTILNHGIDAQTRQVPFTGINGKLSEYHAAVGLAELDGWERKKEKWQEVQALYGILEGSSYTAVNSTHLVSVPDAVEVQKIMQGHGIQTRVAWYGCHDQPVYKDFPRDVLPVTEHLMRTQLAVPKYIGMSEEDVEHIHNCLKLCRTH
jgi:dTDP-4-amino-4,6-dideoxygalactose transaminase